MRIDSLGAPAMVTWQLTRDCGLACLHCCTDSAPGRALPGELSAERALSLCAEIAAAGVPYAMIVGGEPTRVPHFLAVCEALGRAGVLLKIETNGQDLSREAAERLARLPVRSIQISLDGALPATYARQRPGGELSRALAAGRLVRELGMPLEVTFAPTRLNIAEAPQVVELALELGAFRFNTGKLMRLGTAAKLWERLEPSAREYEGFLGFLRRRAAELSGRLELCFEPFSLEEELAGRVLEPSGTLLLLPDGRVKVAAPLPFTCADLKSQTLPQAWDAYRAAWRREAVREAARRLAREPALSARANAWEPLEDLPAMVSR